MTNAQALADALLQLNGIGFDVSPVHGGDTLRVQYLPAIREELGLVEERRLEFLNVISPKQGLGYATHPERDHAAFAILSYDLRRLFNNRGYFCHLLCHPPIAGELRVTAIIPLTTDSQGNIIHTSGKSEIEAIAKAWVILNQSTQSQNPGDHHASSTRD